MASEVRLERAAELLSGQPAPFAPHGERPAPRDVPTPRPLTVERPHSTVQLNGAGVRVLVRGYEVG